MMELIALFVRDMSKYFLLNSGFAKRMFSKMII